MPRALPNKEPRLSGLYHALLNGTHYSGSALFNRTATGK